MNRRPLARAILGALVLVSAMRAGIVTVNATASGFYYQNGTFTASGNYAVGWHPAPSEPPGELRDYFVFDLTGVTGVITAATLRAFNPSNGFNSPDSTETFALFDVSTAIATLTAGTGGVAAFTDLGSGTGYGSTAVSGASNNANVDVTLNSAALAFLNGASGQVAFGGAITTFSTSDTSGERIFESSDASMTRQLILTTSASVPEPGTWPLFAAAIPMLYYLRRRVLVGARAGE